MRKTLSASIGLAFAATAVGIAGHALAAAQGAGRAAPTFQVDPSWPQLPNDWVMGNVSSVAVDRHDHIWLLHRPNVGVPEGKKDHVAPPVLEFDPAGKFLHAWGGPGNGFEWPDQEHGITVDFRDHVWIGGSARLGGPGTGRNDDMILEFTNQGKFLRQLGHRDGSRGNADTENVHAPADIFVYEKTKEILVADGYGNRRVIVHDLDTGKFKRLWGGTGSRPIDVAPAAPRGAGPRGGGTDAAPAGGGQRAAPPRLDTDGPGPQQFGTVHGVKVSNDGIVYVGDRDNRRIQLFTLDGKFLRQVFVNRAGPAAAGVGSIAFSPDKDQRFMLLADFGNSKIAVLDRKSLDVLYQFGMRGPNPGEFQGVHMIAVDSKGNLYAAEVAPGNRAQRFLYKGLSEHAAALN